MAIFREQGVNGHKEMANAFRLVGFDCFDINTNDIINNPEILNTYKGLVACGGFSYGDVLGAGRGWANKIIHNENAYSALSCLLYTSPSPRDVEESRMPSSA